MYYLKSEEKEGKKARKKYTETRNIAIFPSREIDKVIANEYP